MDMVRDRPERRVLSRLDTGRLIREARDHAGLTQTQLAERLATKQSVVSRWERGADVPRVDTLGRILQACGFEADITFRRHDDEDRTQLALNLAMTPAQRLQTVEHVSRFATSARRRDEASA